MDHEEFHDFLRGDGEEPSDEDKAAMKQFEENVDWLTRLETPSFQYVFFDSKLNLGAMNWKRDQSLISAAGQVGTLLHDEENPLPILRFNPAIFGKDAPAGNQSEKGQPMQWLLRELLSRVSWLRDRYEEMAAKSTELRPTYAYLPGQLYVMQILDREEIPDAVLEYMEAEGTRIRREAQHYSVKVSVPSARIQDAIALKVHELMGDFAELRPLSMKGDLTVEPSAISTHTLQHDDRAFASSLSSLSSSADALATIARKLLEWRKQKRKETVTSAPVSEGKTTPVDSESRPDAWAESEDIPFRILGSTDSSPDSELIRGDVKELICRLYRLRSQHDAPRGESSDPYKEGAEYARSILESVPSDVLRQVRACATIVQLDTAFNARSAESIARHRRKPDTPEAILHGDFASMASRMKNLLGARKTLPFQNGQLSLNADTIGREPQRFSHAVFRFSLAAKTVWLVADSLLADRGDTTEPTLPPEIRKEQIRSHWDPDGNYTCSLEKNDVIVSLGSEQVITLRDAAECIEEIKICLPALREIDWESPASLERWCSSFPDIWKCFMLLSAKTLPRILSRPGLQERPERLAIAKNFLEVFSHGGATMILRHISSPPSVRSESAKIVQLDESDLQRRCANRVQYYMAAAELFTDTYLELVERSDDQKTLNEAFSEMWRGFVPNREQKAYTEFADNMRSFGASILQTNPSQPIRERVRVFLQGLDSIDQK